MKMLNSIIIVLLLVGINVNCKDEVSLKSELFDFIRCAGLGAATGYYITKITHEGAASNPVYNLMFRQIGEEKCVSRSQGVNAIALVGCNLANISLPKFFSWQTGRRTLYSIIGMLIGCGFYK